MIAVKARSLESANINHEKIPFAKCCTHYSNPEISDETQLLSKH